MYPYQGKLEKVEKKEAINNSTSLNQNESTFINLFLTS